MRHLFSIFIFLFLAGSVRAQVTLPNIAPSSPVVDTLPELFPGYVNKLDRVTRTSSSGISVQYFNVDSVQQQFSWKVDFHFSKSALNRMANAFLSNDTLKTIPDSLNEKMDGTICFGKMTMRWNNLLKGFVSEGKIPVLSVNGKKLGRYVDGMILLELKRSGNVLNFYFESDSAKWFTFNYANGIMLGFSSLQDFNDELRKGSLRRHTVEAMEEKGEYHYVLGSANERLLMMKKRKRSLLYSATE